MAPRAATLAGDSARVTAREAVSPVVPKARSITGLRAEAKECTGCGLYKCATQTVFGEGPARPLLMMVGEQPGDAEDRAGRPFVGAAGKLLDKSLIEAGIDRREVYVTNAVKHFKWVQRGKKRMHQKPHSEEILACGPWLTAEIERLRPKVILCLGVTAAKAVLGRVVRVTHERGKKIDTRDNADVVATVHPASVLRAVGPSDREEAYARFVADLKSVAKLLT